MGRALVMAVMVGMAGVLGACGSDGDVGGGSVADREQAIRTFFQAGGAGDCPTIEELSTSDFQQRLGCDWMTAMSGDTRVTSLALRDGEDAASGELDYLVTLDSPAFNGDMNVELVSNGGEWLINDVNAVMDAD